MTSRERLLAAARREPVDTIPIAPRLGYAATVHVGSPSNANAIRLRQIYDYDPFLEVHGNVYPFNTPYETFRYAPDVDVTLDSVDQGPTRVVTRTIRTPDGDLTDRIRVPNPGRTEYGVGPNPLWEEHMVKGPEDLPRIRHLMPGVSRGLANEFHGWEAALGDGGVTRCAIWGPIDNQVGRVISVEDLMVAYLQDRGFATGLVGMFWSQIMSQTKAMLEEGVRFIRIPWYWSSLSTGWSPEIFREWFLPMIAEQVELIHSYDALVDYYDDGKCMEILPFMAGAGVDIFETCTPPPVGDFDLAEAKRLYGDRMTFLGYVDLIYILQMGTVEDVRRTIQEACEIGGRDGGFILGTSDSVREGTPIENIDAYFRYGREYGRHCHCEH